MRIDAGGAELDVVWRGPGDGPPLVFIHGFPFSRHMWKPQLEAFSDRWRAVAYDLRGLGASEVGHGQYTMELMVDDLVAVLDELGLKRVVACGLSMGGYVLLRALERDPGRFRAAVLCDTRSGADDNEGKLGRARAIQELRRDGAEAYARDFTPRVLGATTLRERPEVVEAAREMIGSNSVRGMVGAQLAMLARTDTTGVLSGLDLPVLSLAGEEDDLTPPEVAREMAVAIGEGARVATIPAAGHLSSMENPRAFNEALGAFLDEVAAAGGRS